VASPGDTVHFTNRQFLAFCYMHRHSSNAVEVDYSILRADCVPIYPQYEIPEMSPFMATCHTGKFDGKMMDPLHPRRLALAVSLACATTRSASVVTSRRLLRAALT
jgi:hypothetical protein